MFNIPVYRDRKWTLRLAVLAITLALIVLIVAQNFVVVEVRLIARQVEARLAWALLIAFGLGILAGLLLPRPWRRGED